eukprot:g7862.t1
MAKKKKSKKGRVAAHIRENQGKRAAAAASGGEVGADKRAPLLAPPLGVGKPKRPREPEAVAAGVAARDDPARKEKERTDANNYLAAWLSVRKAKEAAEEAGVPPPTSNGVWKFNKNTQAWLLRNAFSDDQIGEKSFGTLCLYLEGLKGAGRQRVLAAAQEIIDKHGPDEGEEQTAVEREAAREAAALEVATPGPVDVEEESAASVAAVAPSGYNSDSTDEGEEGESDSRGNAVGAAGEQGGGGVAAAPQAGVEGVGGGEFSFSFFGGKAPETISVGAPRQKQRLDSDSGDTSSSGDSSDDDDDDDQEENGAGGADGAAQASAPAEKKRRKARSALTGVLKAAAKAKAAAVAYERALQVAEVLA